MLLPMMMMRAVRRPRNDIVTERNKVQLFLRCWQASHQHRAGVADVHSASLFGTYTKRRCVCVCNFTEQLHFAHAFSHS